jgi:hypothetical protein
MPDTTTTNPAPLAVDLTERLRVALVEDPHAAALDLARHLGEGEPTDVEVLAGALTTAVGRDPYAAALSVLSVLVSARRASADGEGDPADVWALAGALRGER